MHYGWLLLDWWLSSALSSGAYVLTVGTGTFTVSGQSVSLIPAARPGVGVVSWTFAPSITTRPTFAPTFTIGAQMRPTFTVTPRIT